ncbi:MAG: metal-dependent hydrolase [Myxococcaceae bacterium]|nr:metal-dependent hydrolase [Myxococcaceae bacterium]
MPAFHPRLAAFDFSRTPLHWMPGDPQLTHTINVLHLLLPAGERWFVDVFKDALPHVKNPELRRRMKAFMGQEEIHARAHEAIMGHLRAQGIDPAPYLERLDWMFETLLSKNARPFLGERAWLVRRLSVVAAIEHVTCVLATWLLSNHQRLEAKGADGAMLDCLKWHASEEVEHRRVAYEVLQALGASGWHRAAAMAVVFPVLTGIWARGTSTLMRLDPTAPGRASWARFARHGLDGTLPTFPGITVAIARYLKPGHDPHDENAVWPLARAFLRDYEGRLAA